MALPIFVLPPPEIQSAPSFKKHKLENTGVSDCLCTAKDTAEEVVEGLNSVGRQVVVVLNCMNSMARWAAEVVVDVDWAMRPKSANSMGEARAEPTTYGPLA